MKLRLKKKRGYIRVISGRMLKYQMQQELKQEAMALERRVDGVCFPDYMEKEFYALSMYQELIERIGEMGTQSGSFSE